MEDDQRKWTFQKNCSGTQFVIKIIRFFKCNTTMQILKAKIFILLLNYQFVPIFFLAWIQFYFKIKIKFQHFIFFNVILSLFPCGSSVILSESMVFGHFKKNVDITSSSMCYGLTSFKSNRIASLSISVFCKGH